MYLVLTLPNVPLRGLVSTVLLAFVPQFGWFSQLKASKRNQTLWVSDNRNCLKMPTLWFWKPGP